MAGLPLWQNAILFGVAYFACAEGSMLLNATGSPNASFWLPSGLYVAVLLLHDFKTWPWLVLAATVANVLFDLLQGTPGVLIFVFVIANTTEAIVGAWLVRTFVATRPTIAALRDYLGLLLFAGVLGTLLGAVISVTGQMLLGMSQSFVKSVTDWWGSTAMATLLVSPCILAWSSETPTRSEAISQPKRLLEAAVLLAGLVAATWCVLVFGKGINSPNKSCFTVFLMWGALRLGIRGAAAVCLIGGLAVGFCTEHYLKGLTPADLASRDYVLTMQVFLAALAALGLIPAIVIAERDTTLNELRKSEERFQLAVRGSTDGIWDWNLLTNAVFYSERCRELLGYSRAEFPDMFASFEAVLHPDDTHQVLNAIEAHLKQRMAYEVEFRLRTREGVYRWFRGRGQAIWNAGGCPVRMAGSITDITERKIGEQSIRESEEKFAKAFRSSPNGIAITDLATGRYIDVNESFCRIYGYTQGEMLGRTSLELGVFDSPEHREQVIAPVRTVGHIKDAELHMRTRNGEPRTLLFSGERIELGGKQCMVLVIFDITARLETEEQLENTGRQLRALTYRLQSLREEERTHLAREIHDHLGQLLTALSLDLRLLERRANEVADIELRDSLQRKITSARQLSGETITSVQKIATELRPAILDRLGLEAALEAEGQAFHSRTGVNCQWTLPSSTVALEPDQATAVFRIFQEILTNVARHAHAANLAVRLSHENHRLLLEVDDDGVGIEPGDIAKPTSLGLLGMRERAAILGGTITFSRKDPRGTAVAVRIPLNGKVGQLA